MTYTPEYTGRHNIPSDIVMQVGADEISPPTTPPTYEVQISMTLDPGAAGRTVRVYVAQVLDYYPTSPSYSRNCFRNATATQDVPLTPGENVLITETLQVDSTSASNPDDMSIYAWAQVPNGSGPAEVYQSAIIDYPFEALYAIKISLPDGVPEFIPPDESTDISVRIQNGSEDVLPDSAMLYYRYDGGEFIGAPLTALGGEYFIATLPAPGCGAQPEFYISAEGDGGSAIVYPADAPAELLTTTVAVVTTLLDDNFDNDLGWTVYNDPSLTHGAWERAVPGGFASPDRSPLADYDGSGKCFVTENTAIQDIDGGPTVLISPVFDLTGMTDPYVRYARYINCDDAATPPYIGADYMDVELSGDGTEWVQADHATGVGPKDHTGWVYTQLRVLDWLPLTSQFQMRFSLADNPNNSQTEGGVDDVWLFDLSCEEGPQYDVGDLNCDGFVNGYDIDPFVLALTDPTAYGEAYSSCDYMLADVNGDGSVNGYDIDPFVVLLTGGGY
jgi:hypothetical protein